MNLGLPVQLLACPPADAPEVGFLASSPWRGNCGGASGCTRFIFRRLICFLTPIARPHLIVHPYLQRRLTSISPPTPTDTLPVPAGFEAETAAAFVCDAAFTLQLDHIGRPHPVETVRQKIFQQQQQQQPIRSQMQTPPQNDSESLTLQKNVSTFTLRWSRLEYFW